MESQIDHNFIDSLKLVETRVINIPSGFTSVCNRCGVGIMKPFKTRLVGHCKAWKVDTYIRLGGTGIIRVAVLKRLAEIWKKFCHRFLKIHSKSGFSNDLDIFIDVALDLI